MTTWQTKLSIPEPQEVNNTLLARRDSTATPGQVWAVIADGWTYSQWVVGNSRMRAVDADWSEPGSKIHHTIGGPPCRLRSSVAELDGFTTSSTAPTMR